MSGWLLTSAGAAAGVVQARALARALRRAGPTAFLARLVLVGGVLAFAADAGHLAQCTAGWLTGFTTAGVLLAWRLG